ncbi:MAG: hypothetical protein PHF85_03985, partial [Bacilli bacterium]|nr:hypothetical protein [Bacilli bacterium]
LTTCLVNNFSTAFILGGHIPPKTPLILSSFFNYLVSYHLQLYTIKKRKKLFVLEVKKSL